MKDGRVKQAFRPKLLALVLALAITWYTLNPAPGPVRPRTRGGDGPDAKRREGKSPPGLARPPAPNALTRDDHPDDSDELDWPEYIY